MKIRVLVLTVIIIMSQHNFIFCATGNKFAAVPILTSNNFDNRVTKIEIKFKNPDIHPNPMEIGTGFFITDGGKFIYLVSAGHVFKKALQVLLNNEGSIIFYQKFEDKDAEVQNIVLFEKDLVDSWKKGLLQFSKDNSIDIGILKVRDFIKEEELKEKDPVIEKDDKPRLFAVCIDISNVDSVCRYGELEKAGEIYFFGFPSLPTLKKLDRSHLFDSIIRKGIISKKIDKNKIIIDGFVSSGNSGSPVFARKEFVGMGRGKIEFRLIGLITEFLPYEENKPLKKSGSEVIITKQMENSGLGLVESVDNIVDILEQFGMDSRGTSQKRTP